MISVLHFGPWQGRPIRDLPNIGERVHSLRNAYDAYQLHKRARGHGPIVFIEEWALLSDGRIVLLTPDVWLIEWAALPLSAAHAAVLGEIERYAAPVWDISRDTTDVHELSERGMLYVHSDGRAFITELGRRSLAAYVAGR